MILPLLLLGLQGPVRDNTAAATLPVRSVTLFSSGVSFLLREGEVTGDATIPLSFRTNQVNDILKSLVLIDEKGQVQPAVYATKDPVSRTLQSFAVDVTQPLDRNALLNRLRGQMVTVTEQPLSGTGRTLTGKIVSVENKTLLSNEGRAVSAEYLNLLSENGLQTLRLDMISQVRFENAQIAKEFQEALSLLASGADEKRRSVVLRFDGQGARRVRVGYINESPLWKVSYRLLLSGGGIGGVPTVNGKPYLQGWALVENTTDEDWSNVQLTLISGRPISFIQDLYQPLYLNRPVIGPDIVGSPLPQLAEAAVESADKKAELAAKMAISNAMARGQAGSGGFGGGGRGGGGFGMPGVTGLAEATDAAVNAPEALMRASVASQATGEKQGELFSYRIKTPISLPRQQAAMIPVVAQEIDGEKVSLYNADLDTRFPLNGIRIKNNTGLHLKGGPVTLFDEGNYAGDARMLDIPPGDNRILTYAVDLAVMGDRQIKDASSVETSIVVRRGVLIASRRETTETLYSLTNKSEKPRLVLVEHPFNPEFKLTAPEKPTERTPSLYRFSVSVAPGKTESLTVKTERPLSESYGLLDTDLNFIEVTLQRKSGVSEKLKTALREVLTRRRKVQDLRSQAGAREAEIKSIEQDQERVRRNMSALDRNAPLYQRYVKQLDEQETRIQQLRTQAIELTNQAAAADRELRTYLDNLDIAV